MSNIPIYRAKKLNIDEFIIGLLTTAFRLGTGEKYYQIQTIDNFFTYEIDITTLAIHFPDMIASDSDRLLPNGKKDLRIFASLQEDGTGGDNVEYKLNDWKKAISVCRYKDKQIVYAQNEVKITGIKQ